MSRTLLFITIFALVFGSGCTAVELQPVQVVTSTASPNLPESTASPDLPSATDSDALPDEGQFVVFEEGSQQNVCESGATCNNILELSAVVESTSAPDGDIPVPSDPDLALLEGEIDIPVPTQVSSWPVQFRNDDERPSQRESIARIPEPEPAAQPAPAEPAPEPINNICQFEHYQGEWLTRSGNYLTEAEWYKKAQECHPTGPTVRGQKEYASSVGYCIYGSMYGVGEFQNTAAHKCSQCINEWNAGFKESPHCNRYFNEFSDGIPNTEKKGVE